MCETAGLAAPGVAPGLDVGFGFHGVTSIGLVAMVSCARLPGSADLRGQHTAGPVAHVGRKRPDSGPVSSRVGYVPFEGCLPGGNAGIDRF